MNDILPLAISAANSAVLLGAIIYGAGRLRQSVSDIRSGVAAVRTDVQALDVRFDGLQREVSHMKGVLDERERQYGRRSTQQGGT